MVIFLKVILFYRTFVSIILTVMGTQETNKIFKLKKTLYLLGYPDIKLGILLHLLYYILRFYCNFGKNADQLPLNNCIN